jgi:O-antigen ligase
VGVKNRRHQTADRARVEGPLPIADRVSWLIVSATTLALPVVVTVTGKDAFRLPKYLLLEGSGILLAAVAVCATVIGTPVAREARWSRPLLFVIAAVLLWYSAATVFSTNRILSLFSLLTVAAATMHFVATYNAVQYRSLTVLYIALAPASINAVIAIAQHTGFWNPVITDAGTDRLRTIALLGNPNDVGMFLVAPALAATALGIASRRHRAAAIIIALILTLGLLASETIGAIAALSAGLFVLLLRIQARAAVAAALVTLLLAVLVIRLSPEHWSATRSRFSAVASGDIDLFVSGRLPAFRAAWRMFRQRPLLGVGLGCFSFRYFDEKVALTMRGQTIQRFYRDPNFRAVHNEHLQILAEGGLPAYAIFIAALVILGRVSFRQVPGDDTPHTIFARRLALPLAIAFSVLALSSFPLHVAAPTQNGLYICALTLAWSRDARD